MWEGGKYNLQRGGREKMVFYVDSWLIFWADNPLPLVLMFWIDRSVRSARLGNVLGRQDSAASEVS
jgi:hypothetical protein